MVDAPPGIQAFLSVMGEQQDHVIFEYLSGIRRDVEKRDGYIDEGEALEYVLLRAILEDERDIDPTTIEEVLVDTKPLSGRERTELFDQRIERFCLIFKER